MTCGTSAIPSQEHRRRCEKFDEFLSLLQKCGAPLLVFSAGFGPVIEDVLVRDSAILGDSDGGVASAGGGGKTQSSGTAAAVAAAGVSVIANRAIWDADGKMVGFEDPLIHSCNKGAACGEENANFAAALAPCKNRDSVLLMGDGFGDVNMAVGLGTRDGGVFKVGFANYDPDETKLQKYLDLFDVVLLGDPSLAACCQMVDLGEDSSSV